MSSSPDEVFSLSLFFPSFLAFLFILSLFSYFFLPFLFGFLSFFFFRARASLTKNLRNSLEGWEKQCQTGTFLYPCKVSPGECWRGYLAESKQEKVVHTTSPGIRLTSSRKRVGLRQEPGKEMSKP